jgi:hypothetical protein
VNCVEVAELVYAGEDSKAPKRPMMEGSRWWSCGIALNKCVIRRAPERTPARAVSEDAMLH